MLRRCAMKLGTGLIAMSLLVVQGPAQQSKHEHEKEKAQGKPVMWRQPADPSSLNLLLGPGGEDLKPDLSKVTFIEEEKGGYSTKYRVRDGSGREWVAKIGKEGQPETAASRLLWAIGYFTDITYLVPSATIEGKGTFENVRFEARPKGVKRLQEWKWNDNPFLGTKELPGLKVMMVLLDNWDIKDSNNRVLEVRNPDTGEVELRYIVSDLGATFGKTGGIVSRTRNKPDDYAKAKFVNEVKGNFVDLHYSGKRKDLVRGITVGQARWIGELLSRLSDDQISDAFRAANYSPEDVQLLTKALRSRINELVALPQAEAVEYRDSNKRDSVY